MWKSVRGRIHKLHLKLSEKFTFYHKWHHYRHYKKVHWSVFGVHALTLFIALVMFFSSLLGQHTFAASRNYPVTNKEEWEAGTNTNLDIEDTFGDAKIAANGSWTARTWKTPPDSLTLGVSFAANGGNIYTMRGNGDKAFWRYSTTSNKWDALADAPHGAYYGSHLEAGDADTVYAIFGNYIKKFYKYTISTNTWTALPDAPDTTGPGSTLAYDGTKVFLLRGSNTQDFWAYDIAGDSWETIAGPPATVSTASDLVYDGSNYLYTLRGNGTATFYRYSISGNSWTTMSSNYPLAINETTHMAIKAGAIYVQHGVATTNFYKCTISGTSCSGGWTTLTATPLATRYAGVVYNPADGYIYSFRGNGGYDIWKYNTASNSFVGPAAYPQTIATGGDLIWDGANTVYSLKGGAAASGFYAYSISANTWMAKSVANLPALSYDTKAVKAGNFIYLFQGNSTAFWAYDTTNDAGGWVAKTAAPASIINGGSLAYPGSGDRIYALRGAGTNTFYSYSIANNNWTTFDPTDLPAGMNANIGARLISDGTNIFAILGSGSSKFYRYNVGANDWTAMGRTPFTQYYGTDLTFYNGSIYALGGYYSNKLYEYSISAGSWRKLPNIQTQYQYDIGPYNGASLEYYGSNGLMMTQGRGYQDVLSYTVGTNKYLASATYESQSFDLTHVSNWISLTVDKDTPGDSSVTVETQTSADGSAWSGWAAVSGTTIQSPANKYIKVKATLSAATDGSQTPVLHSFGINYDPDETPPGLPGNFSCKSQEVGGVDLTSGQAYLYMHPYCSWDAAADGESGVAGYYVYIGSNASADPVTDGSYQTDTNYVANREMTTGNNYLIVKTKDNAGNISASSITGFTYNYNGVSPYQSVSKTSTADFSGGVNTNISALSDQLKLSGKAGFWKEGRLALAPATIGYGSGIVYKPSVNKIYVARGQNTTTFWEYDIATDVWTAKSSTGLGTLYYGGGIVNGQGNYIYAMRGGTFSTFYRYDITNDAAGWVDASAEDAPTAFGYGGALIYDGSRYIYALRGNNDDVFYRFDPQTTADGQWSAMANVNFGYPDQTSTNVVNNGGDLTYDGSDHIYAIQGNLLPGGFSKYTISSNSWAPQEPLPMSPGQGSSLVWDSVTGKVFYTPGSYSSKMFAYDTASEEWTSVSSAPSNLAYGSRVYAVNGTLYALRGAGTQTFYKYNTVKNYWYTPSFNIFGPNWNGTSYFAENYGASIVHGDDNDFYAIRGNYDNRFVKYNSASGTMTQLPNVPSGTYSGAALVYDSTQKAVYLINGLETSFFKFDIATTTWSEETSDPLPIVSGYGASMVYDGSRYIYYARGANTISWYRYDTQASVGSRWSSALPATGLGGQGYGSQLLYKDGFIYTLRGQNVNPNPFYKFDVSQLPGGSWSTLTSLGTAVYNDGFLVDGNNGYLYAARAANTNEWWQYSLSENSWSAASNFPGQIYAGGAGKSNGTNKIFVLPGAGTNTWQDGIYTYVTQSDSSSFEESGSYTSESLDLTSVYNWTNIKVNYTAPANTTVLVETQTSADNSAWSSWTAVSQEKVTGATHEYAINSPEARYVKVRFTVTSGDGVLSPTISDYQVNYYKDTDAPSNPAALASAKSKVSDGTDITNDNWYNHIAPYFTLPAADSASGATDNSGGSGVAGYYVYFGTDPDAIPSTAGTYQTGLTYTGSVSQNNGTYYLRVQTKDNAGNTQGTPWTAFNYKYDSGLPSNPGQLTANPLSYTSNDNFTFSISGDAADAESGLQKYQYRTGGDNESTWYDFDPALSTSVTIPNAIHTQGKYRDGVNQFYLRVVDNAGNVSSAMNTQYYFGAQAPTPPQNLQVNPSSNTTNSFSFSWDAPAAYVGDVSKIKYYYSVNALPTQYNTNETPTRAAGPSAFATQKGENIFYVVAKDEANNIDYGSYASVPFTANTSAPPSPTYTDVSDISDKEAQQFRLVISWMAPDIDDPANFGGYDIYSSTEEDGSYTKIANTTGTAYVHTNLVKDSKHYYYIVSADKTGNQSAPSSKANATATGRYTRAPKVTKNPEATPKAKSAVIGWVTEREANSSVEYGTTKDLGSSTGNKSTQFETDHKVALGNLEPGTTYYYKVVFVDPDGNIGNSSIESFITSPAPVISNLKIEDLKTTSLTITWETNVPANGDLLYGKTSSYGGSIREDDFPVLKHSVKISNLESDMEYHFQAKEVDGESNIFTSDDYKTKTLPLPVVTGVKVQGKTGVDTPTLNVEYATNVDATTVVRFGTDGGKIKEYVEMDYKKAHSLELTDLLPSRQYTLEITGTDKYGNGAAGQKHQVITLSDTMPPKVLKIVEKKKVLGEGSNAEAQLTLKVSTNEPSTMIVEASKGTSGTDFNIMSNEDPLNTEHTVVLKLGEPGSPYSYRVKFKDASGNQLITETKTFVVAKGNKSALDYITGVFARSFSWLGKFMQ